MKNKVLQLIAISVFAFSTLAHGHKQDDTQMPVKVEACETHQGQKLCSTWIRNGKDYDGTWTDGTTGKVTITFIVVAQAKQTVAAFLRMGDKGTPVRSYSGVLHNGKVHGLCVPTVQPIGNTTTVDDFDAKFTY